jgi:hypothetical protein
VRLDLDEHDPLFPVATRIFVCDFSVVSFSSGVPSSPVSNDTRPIHTFHSLGLPAPNRDSIASDDGRLRCQALHHSLSRSPSTSTSSAITRSSPSSLPVNTIDSNSGFSGLSLTRSWRRGVTLDGFLALIALHGVALATLGVSLVAQFDEHDLALPGPRDRRAEQAVRPRPRLLSSGATCCSCSRRAGWRAGLW